MKPGDLFIACMGHENDARAYIADAVAAGAVAVLFEAGSGFPQEAHVTTPTGHMVPSFGVQNLWQKIEELQQFMVKNIFLTVSFVSAGTTLNISRN